MTSVSFLSSFFVKLGMLRHLQYIDVKVFYLIVLAVFKQLAPIYLLSSKELPFSLILQYYQMTDSKKRRPECHSLAFMLRAIRLSLTLSSFGRRPFA